MLENFLLKGKIGDSAAQTMWKIKQFQEVFKSVQAQRPWDFMEETDGIFWKVLFLFRDGTGNKMGIPDAQF